MDCWECERERPDNDGECPTCGAPKDRDDTDALIDALHTQHAFGDMLLPRDININGHVHPAGRYRLTRV